MAEPIAKPLPRPLLLAVRDAAQTFANGRANVARMIPDVGELIEPCGSHHPDWMAACLGGARLVSVKSGSKTAGVFATRIERWRWGMPFPVVTTWQSDLTFDGTPLVGRDGARETIVSFLRAEKGKPVLFRTIPAGPFRDALFAAAKEINAPAQIVRQWQRAALRLRGTYDEWFEDNFERKRRKEYRRLRARLGEVGNLESLSWSAVEPLDGWIAEFFDLEASGWKGRKGTALAADPRTKAAVAIALHALAREGALRFWKLSLDGKAVAMMFALVSGGKAWLGKIAYDEQFARYSPGVLLILDATKSFYGERAVSVVDSCAIPGHPMIDNIWRDRIEMSDVLVGPAGMWRPLFGAMVAAEHLRARIRDAAKHLYYRIKKGA